MTDLSYTSQELLKVVKTSQNIVVVTGAGISLASGIPTFRGNDPEAIWSRDIMEKATFAFFREQPVESWQWYLQRFGLLADKQPNPGHLALAELERWQIGRGQQFLLVSQNIDILHERAGSIHMVKVHGSADRVRCSRVGCVFGSPFGSLSVNEVSFSRFAVEPIEVNIPHCSRCGSLIRPHILWFDEFYTDHRDFQIAKVMAATEQADMILFVGTSFSVGLTDMVMEKGIHRRIPMFSVDPSASSPHSRVEVLAYPAEAILPEVIRQL